MKIDFLKLKEKYPTDLYEEVKQNFEKRLMDWKNK